MIALLAAAALVFLAFLAGLMLGVFAGRVFRFRSNFGEALVAETMSNRLQLPHLFLNNVTLETQRGTTQIDHILVAETEIFVIETKHYSGWIFGHPSQAEWTQVVFRTLTA